MTPHIPEEFSTRLSGWSPFVIMGNAIPPRDPKEDEEDGDDEEEDDEDEEDEEVQVDQGLGPPWPLKLQQIARSARYPRPTGDRSDSIPSRMG